ncbi:MAG: aquaporin Z [Acidobacteriia bacterium]|nr:aquaporin Z [Terriglobia bacterium]
MKYGAEFFGTFVLIFAGLGTAVLDGGRVGILGIGLAFGLSLMAMIYTIGPISGCHLNPAVTLGMLLSKRISAKESLGYMIAQIVGAIVAAGVVLYIAKGAPDGYSASVSGLAADGYLDYSPGHYTWLAGFVSEMFCTMLLVVTVLGATDKRAPAGFAGIPIALVLTTIHLVGVPVTNGSFNPARSIGPAVFVGGWALQQLWLFIVAPMVGAVLASRVYLGLKPPAEQK